MRKMENSDSHKVAFEEALRCLSEFNISRALNQNKKKKFLHWFWKGSTSRGANWIWEKPDTSGVGLHERNLRG